MQTTKLFILLLCCLGTLNLIQAKIVYISFQRICFLKLSFLRLQLNLKITDNLSQQSSLLAVSMVQIVFLTP